MAVHASITGAPIRAPGKFEEISGCSRRALFGGAIGLAAVALPAATIPVASGWHQLLAQYRAEAAKADRYFDTHYGPLLKAYPALPQLELRVGTHFQTGAPLTHYFSIAELESEDPPFVMGKAWRQARANLTAHEIAARDYEATTDYCRQRDSYDALEDQAWALGEEVLITPAPDAAGLATKIDILLNGDRYDDRDEKYLGPIKADAFRLGGHA